MIPQRVPPDAMAEEAQQLMANRGGLFFPRNRGLASGVQNRNGFAFRFCGSANARSEAYTEPSCARPTVSAQCRTSCFPSLCLHTPTQGFEVNDRSGPSGPLRNYFWVPQGTEESVLWVASCTGKPSLSDRRNGAHRASSAGRGPWTRAASCATWPRGGRVDSGSLKWPATRRHRRQSRSDEFKMEGRPLVVNEARPSRWVGAAVAAVASNAGTAAAAVAVADAGSHAGRIECDRCDSARSAIGANPSHPLHPSHPVCTPIAPA